MLEVFKATALLRLISGLGQRFDLVDAEWPFAAPLVQLHYAELK